MNPLPPIDAVPLFPEERSALLDLLRSLSTDQWVLPTVCEGWSVKDIVAHLVADDVGRLAWQRDGHSVVRFEPMNPETFEAELRVFINRQNESWVEVMRRLSPRIIIDMLEWSGRETQALFESLDPNGTGLGVSWAGETESVNWFDLAREYTERWHHQAQIREAVGAPMLYEPRLFAAAIETKIRAVPHALRDTAAAEGTQIRIAITGEVTRTYDVVRGTSGWALSAKEAGEPAAIVTMSADTAWRLLTHNVPRAEIVRRSTVTGDVTLADAVFDSFALVA